MEPIKAFTTHTGERVTGERLQAALKKVAEDWRQIGRNIRKEDAYASHVTEAQKDQRLREHEEYADSIAAGYVQGLTIAQRLNTELTGECVALLGGKK